MLGRFDVESPEGGDMAEPSANNPIGRSALLRRLLAAWRRFAYDEYPDRMTWAEAETAIGRAEKGRAFPDSWLKDVATRDHFYVISVNGHAKGKVDRQTGRFEYTHVTPR